MQDPNHQHLQDFFDEFLENVTSHPFNPRSFIYGDIVVELRPWPGNDSIHISHIQTLAPRTGAANNLMSFLTELADKHGVVLDLIAKSTDRNLISTKKLVDFYKKWGFETSDFANAGDGTRMFRTPSASAESLSEESGPFQLKLTNSWRTVDLDRTRVSRTPSASAESLSEESGPLRLKLTNRWRRNPARARRSEQRKIEKRSVDDFGEEWVDTDYKWIEHPPFLTEGHFDLPMVKEAARIASRAKESKQLGRGHFGEAFLVETSKGPVIVKIAAERMLYQDRRPWTREEQQANLMHEAGVANELEEMGYDIAPRSVYVELEDGTPAIVREYGEEVEPGEISGQEYYELERALFDLEKDTGWSVQDELLLLQRPDGSLFIGDVGIWSAPDVKKRREWSLVNSHLPSLLGNLGERLFGQRFSSLDEVQTYQERLEEHSREGRDPDHVFTKIFREELEKALASREAVEIPSPSKAYRILESVRYGE